MTDKRVEALAYAIEKFALQNLSDWNYSFSTSEKLAQAAISSDPVTEDVKRLVEMAYKNGYDECDIKGDDQDHNECWDESAAKYELKKWIGE